MKKHLTVLSAVFALLLILSGCGVDSGLYGELCEAQENTARLESGKITLKLSYDEEGATGEFDAELIFKKGENGNYAYCQKQFDRNENVVFCEYSDGASVMHWLIGRGWEEMGGADFTEEMPHRYLAMLTQKYERGMLSTLEKEECDGGVRYVFSVSPQNIKSGETDGNMSAVSQNIAVTVNGEGYIVSCNEETVMRNEETGGECVYRAEITCSEQNIVTSVEKPQLKEHYGRK